MPHSSLHDDLQEKPADNEEDHYENRFRTIMKPEFDINEVDDETMEDDEDKAVKEVDESVEREIKNSLSTSDPSTTVLPHSFLEDFVTSTLETSPSEMTITTQHSTTEKIPFSQEDSTISTTEISLSETTLLTLEESTTKMVSSSQETSTLETIHSSQEDSTIEMVSSTLEVSSMSTLLLSTTTQLDQSETSTSTSEYATLSTSVVIPSNQEEEVSGISTQDPSTTRLSNQSTSITSTIEETTNDLSHFERELADDYYTLEGEYLPENAPETDKFHSTVSTTDSDYLADFTVSTLAIEVTKRTKKFFYYINTCMTLNNGSKIIF